ncbi:hypothetical protein HUF15_22020 [Streptomyces samsunensis]|uniref:hypothetical protein n=1 Tax=Streptomyces malaysiensis TaxID=92644 RepID=UPI001583435C|nr:hypothetical protein [Streptomyces samsunensis]NUH39409.1 hypothetical protein [Streptomyces samsunensis]
MTTTRTLPWAPPNTEDIEPLPVGEWWDAISAPTPVADRALELLGGRSGAVIQDDTDEPIPIAIEHTGSVARTTIYACPTHARHHPRDTVTHAAAMRRALDQGRAR